MRMIYKLISMIMLLATSACAKSQLEQALEQASDNRSDLETALEVLSHDSLKRAAAERLIIASVNYATTASDDLDSLKRRLPGPRLEGDELKEWKRKNLHGQKTAPDITRLTGLTLIDNVNLAVDVWRSRPWARHYSFDDFCEYILPYRIDNEPLENWRQSYLDRYSAAYDSLCHGVDDPAEAARLMLTYIREQRVRTLPDLSYPHLGALYLLDNRLGYCRDHCDIAIYVLRSLGIPVATDFYESSPSYNSRHFWTAVIDTLHQVREFNLGERPSTWDNPVKRKKGKVYRKRFAPREEALTAGEDIYPFFRNPLISDVSAGYGFSSAITVTDPALKSPQQYLSVYDGHEYKPIAISGTRGGNATFADLEENVIYFPTCYEATSRLMRPSYYPILSGETQNVFIPDTTVMDTVRIWRKYPMQKTKAFLSNTVGMRIEGSERIRGGKSFSIELRDTPTINILRLPLPEGLKLRYVTLRAPGNKRIELSEITVATEAGDVKPVAVTDGDTGTDITETVLPIITDERWETCYVSKKDGEQITLDFGHIIRADGLTIIPRTDDNFVHPGDEYELFYHDGARGWKSLGRKKAIGSSIDYPVPRNAVLWLKNHTRGREERPFTITDGRQTWW